MPEKTTKQNLWTLLFFPITILYQELLLRFCAVGTAPVDYHYLYLAVFAAAFGCLFYAIAQCPKSRK